VWLHGV